MMTLTPPHISVRLRGFYSKIPSGMPGTMARALNNIDCTPDEFVAALKHYRSDPGQARFCPNETQMVQSLQDVRMSMPANKAANEERLHKRDFNNLIFNHGWDKAMDILTRPGNHAMRSTVERDGYTQGCERYFGMSAWYRRFLEICFEELEPRRAFLYGADNAPTQKQRDWFERIAPVVPKSTIPHEPHNAWPDKNPFASDIEGVQRIGDMLGQFTG